MLSQRKLIALLALLVLALSACTPVVPVASAGLAQTYIPAEAEVQILEFDVAEDMNRFIFDQDVVYEDGMPADGSSFITRGYLYEPGTLTDSNGVTPMVRPSSPTRSSASGSARGYMINDAGHATGGVWVFSTQFFQLGSEPGAQSIVTQGYELADTDVAIARAITGGTGDFKLARGESSQTLLGLNATEGVNLRVQIAIEK